MDFDNAEVIIFWNNTLNDQIFLFQGRCVVALWKGYRIPSRGAVGITQQIKSSIMRIDTAAVLLLQKVKIIFPCVTLHIQTSPKTQARDGNSLDAQQAALTAAGAEKIYTDTFTGTKIERPEFDRLRAQLRRGDVLIVTKLDRLARSVSQASGLITEMIDEGITINVLNLGILSNDSVNTLLRNVLLSFAQFERDMIVQRTQEGKAVARATDPNFREGRPPKFDTEQLDHAMALLEDHSYAQVVKLTGISKSTLIRERKRRQLFAICEPFAY